MIIMQGKKIYRTFLLSFLTFLSVNSYSQSDFQRIDLLYPLDIPMSVSGCFGDLRSNALHSGLDFRTKSKIGFPVYATADGYISRIKIEPGGYGRAVYITHPTGWVSVYAHLDKLCDVFDKYVKSQQYKSMQFSVDLFPAKDSLQVKKGDIIGFTGNAGASTGPHLHFEIREEKSQLPVNIVKLLDFPVVDTVSPIIEKLWLYTKYDSIQLKKTFQRKEFLIESDKKQSWLKNIEAIKSWGDIAFGIEVYDPAEKSANKTGIYSIDVYVNDSLVFNQTFNKFAFSESRYVNAIIDYEYFMATYKRINRLFVLPNNRLTIYNNCKNSGIISVRDTGLYKVNICVQDANQNYSELSFFIRGEEIKNAQLAEDSVANQESTLIKCKVSQIFERKNIQVLFNENSLYDDLNFFYCSLPAKNGFYSQIHSLHNKYTPIHQAITLRIKPDNIPERFLNKAVIALVDSAKLIYGSGFYKNDYVETNIRVFGNYAVVLDTIAPVILPELKNKTDFTGFERIAFKITDDLSGIFTYKGYIDDQWALFEYDAKNDLLYYVFDPDRITFGQKHLLYLMVTDARGNSSEYKMDFFK